MNRLVFILLAIAGWFCSSISAQEYTAKVFDSEYFNVIPSFLSSDGKSYVYTAERIYGGTSMDERESVNCTLFDDEFNKVNEFSVEMPIFTNHYFTQYAQRVVTSEEVVIVKTTQEPTDIFEDESEEWIKDFLNELTHMRLEDGTEVYVYRFWEEYTYGNKYPEVYLMLKNGQWYRCERKYQAESTYDYVWGEIKEETHNWSASLLEVNYMQEDGTTGEGKFFRDRFACLTRGIFGDVITYIQPTCEEVSYEIVRETYKEWGTQYLGNGFDVYDSNKRLITSVKLPSGLYLLQERIHILNLSGKKYIVVLATTKEGLVDYMTSTTNTKESIVVFSLDKQTKATQIAIAPVSRVAPRDPRKGETVTVTVDEKYSNEECIVNVVSTEGRSMLRRSIAPGENSIQFNTDSFPQGVYIVTFSGKSGKSEAAKIIVR